MGASERPAGTVNISIGPAEILALGRGAVRRKYEAGEITVAQYNALVRQLNAEFAEIMAQRPEPDRAASEARDVPPLPSSR